MSEKEIRREGGNREADRGFTIMLESPVEKAGRAD